MTAQDQLGIRVAAYRHLFEHNASAIQDRTAYHFIGEGNRDAPPETLRAFAGHTPSVVPQCLGVRPPRTSGDGVRHLRDGRPGLIITVDAVRQLTDDAVEVEGTYYEAPMSAAGSRLLVERRGDGWVVARAKLTWIS